jgi:hypothetical protein
MTLVKDVSLAVTLSREEEAELQAIQSARIALERSFALSSERAKAMQFYAELARSEGFSSAERLQDVALEAIDRLTRAFWLLDKFSKRLQKVNNWIEQRQEQRQQVGSLEDEVARDLERVIKLNQKIYGILAETYEEITTIVNAAWNYLPLELQVITESLVRRLYLGQEELLLVKRLEKAYEQYTPEIYREKLRSLVFFVFLAIEHNKDKPKLELLKLSQRDASISWFKQKTQSLPQSEIGLAEIKELEILKRVVNLDFPPLSDEDLALSAEELFLELDKQEATHE